MTFWDNPRKYKLTERLANVNIAEGGHTVSFTGYNKAEISKLDIDAQNCAALDSACSSTVCGQMWLNNYLDSLSEEDRKKVRSTVGKKTFKLVGGERPESKAEYSLSGIIAGKRLPSELTSYILIFLCFYQEVQ